MRSQREEVHPVYVTKGWPKMASSHDASVQATRRSPKAPRPAAAAPWLRPEAPAGRIEARRHGVEPHRQTARGIRTSAQKAVGVSSDRGRPEQALSPLQSPETPRAAGKAPRSAVANLQQKEDSR